MEISGPIQSPRCLANCRDEDAGARLGVGAGVVMDQANSQTPADARQVVRLQAPRPPGHQGTAGYVFQSIGVAVPPTVQEKEALSVLMGFLLIRKEPPPVREFPGRPNHAAQDNLA